MAPRVPKLLRLHGLSFPVWQLGDGRFASSVLDAGARRVLKFRDFDNLRTALETLALSMRNGDTAALAMTADQRRLAIAAETTLAPLGLSLESAARLLADCARDAGGIDFVADACRQFKHAGGAQHQATTEEVVAHFIRHISADGVSELYLTRMEADLEKFAGQFPGPIAKVLSSAMEEWLREMPVGLRRRRNLRDKLVALFNFARDHKYLHRGLRTEAEMIKRPKVARKAPSIHSPKELDLILTQCAQPADRRNGRKDYMAFLPSIVIAAFAGLRWSEIQRLDWADVHWDDAVIAVGDENKTGYRLAPILPNLMTWLSPYREHVGPVCTEKRPDHAMHSIRSRAGLPGRDRRYANALRHSFVTYRVAVTKNMPQVAIESGHSVSELRKSYNRASLEAVGKQWFGMVRDAANVLQMPLLSMRH